MIVIIAMLLSTMEHTVHAGSAVLNGVLVTEQVVDAMIPDLFLCKMFGKKYQAVHVMIMLCIYDNRD